MGDVAEVIDMLVVKRVECMRGVVFCIEFDHLWQKQRSVQGGIGYTIGILSKGSKRGHCSVQQASRAQEEIVEERREW